MPKRLEQRLKREARAKHFGKARSNAYVYGTLRRLGWKPKRERRERRERREKKRKRRGSHA